MTKTPRWSQKVTEKSNALDLEKGVFTWEDPEEIALSLFHSALTSNRRKGSPLQSAMSMLNFYMNRSGKNLSQSRIDLLNKAKEELRKIAKNRLI